MLEFPEAATLARQWNESIVGKKIARVLPPTKTHKFCWFNGDAADYDAQVRDCVVTNAESFGLFAELSFENGRKLCINDGVNVRFLPDDDAKGPYQLKIVFEDGTSLVFTVAMYGGIQLHDGKLDNSYYWSSRKAVSPLAPEFESRYHSVLAESKPTLSAKALLATEQRFPGIGNGVLQDILFAAGIHPKRKLSTLTDEDRERLLRCTVSTLREMTELDGRDTEKDLYGHPGGYITRMSKNTLPVGCPVCGGPITKEAYMGGSVYYCKQCQPLNGKA